MNNTLKMHNKKIITTKNKTQPHNNPSTNKQTNKQIKNHA